MKKLCMLLAVLAVLALVPAACAGGEETALRLYFPAAPEPDGSLPRAVDSENYYGEPTVDGLLDALLAGPEEAGLTGLFGSDVWLLGWTMEGERLQVDLSAAYGDLTGIDLTLADCCITLTLSQLEGVEQVHVTAGGSDLAYRGRQILSEDDMIFTGAEEEPRLVDVELYFPRSGGRGLGFEVREFTLTEDDDLYATVTLALLAGPESSALRAVFPEGTELLSTRLEEGICYVNFSAALIDQAPAGQAEQDLLLYSIVDTLGNLDAVTAVQLLVEGEVPKSYGSADTTLPLEPDFGLLAGE